MGGRGDFAVAKKARDGAGVLDDALGVLQAALAGEELLFLTRLGTKAVDFVALERTASSR